MAPPLWLWTFRGSIKSSKFLIDLRSAETYLGTPKASKEYEGWMLLRTEKWHTHQSFIGNVQSGVHAEPPFRFLHVLELRPSATLPLLVVAEKNRFFYGKRHLSLHQSDPHTSVKCRRKIEKETPSCLHVLFMVRRNSLIFYCFDLVVPVEDIGNVDLWGTFSSSKMIGNKSFKSACWIKKCRKKALSQIKLLHH